MKKQNLLFLFLLQLFYFIPTNCMILINAPEEVKENIFLRCTEQSQKNLKFVCTNFCTFYKSMVTEQKKYIDILIACRKEEDLNKFKIYATTQDMYSYYTRNLNMHFPKM